MKVVNQVEKFIRETRGHQLNVTVAEAQLLHDFAIWLDKQSAQHRALLAYAAGVWEEEQGGSLHYRLTLYTRFGTMVTS